MTPPTQTPKEAIANELEMIAQCQQMLRLYQVELPKKFPNTDFDQYITSEEEVIKIRKERIKRFQQNVQL